MKSPYSHQQHLQTQPQMQVQQQVVKTVEADRFWIIGDVHGMISQFRDLLENITRFELADNKFDPQTRIAIVSVGDLCDRGPASLETLHLAYYMRYEGWPIGDCRASFHNVLGNHDQYLLRLLNGEPLALDYDTDRTFFQLSGTGVGMMKRYAQFLADSPHVIHSVLPDGQSASIIHDLQAHPETYAGANYVFYGHIALRKPYPAFYPQACNMDTACFRTGILTAVSFPGLQVLQSRGEPADTRVYVDNYVLSLPQPPPS